MSLFSGLANLIRPLGKAASAVTHVPVLGNVVKALPVVGTIASAASIGSDIYGAFSGSSKNLPALPGGNLPPLPGMGAPSIVGKRSVFRNDADVPAALKQFTISKGDLRPYYRSPIKGYVVMHDQNGDPFAIPKQLAKAYFHWKPAKKPPISIGEMNALKKAKRAIHKVRKVHGLIKYVHDNTAHGGKVIVHHKHKKGGHAK